MKNYGYLHRVQMGTLPDSGNIQDESNLNGKHPVYACYLKDSVIQQALLVTIPFKVLGSSNIFP